MDLGNFFSWQPVTNLERNKVQLIAFIKGEDGLIIHLADWSGNHVKIIYDKNVPNIGDWIWAARHSPEVVRSHLSSLCLEADQKNSNLERNAQSFYKISNSDFMKWFDQLPFLDLKHFPEVEHHLYYLNDEVVEVLSDYEPRIITWKE